MSKEEISDEEINENDLIKDSDNKVLLNVCTLGSSKVGKTCIVNLIFIIFVI
jgi:hypothetical protein